MYDQICQGRGGWGKRYDVRSPVLLQFATVVPDDPPAVAAAACDFAPVLVDQAPLQSALDNTAAFRQGIYIAAPEYAVMPNTTPH